MNSKIIINLVEGTISRITFAGIAALALSLCVLAQSPNRGFVPGGGFAVSDFESVNMTNGNVNLSFPLAQLPVGRNGLTTGVYLTYNSKLYDVKSEYLQNQIQPCSSDGWVDDDFFKMVYLRCGYYTKHKLDVSDEGGWRYSAGYSMEVEDRTVPIFALPQNMQPACVTGQTAFYELTYRYKVKVIFPDGSKHEMIPSGYTDMNGDRFYNVHPDGTLIGSCGGSNSSVGHPVYYSVDGTYMRMQYGSNNRWMLYFPDGSYYDFGGGGANPRIYDRNSNYVEFQSGQIVDQFGRSIRFGTDSSTGEKTFTTDGVGGEDVVTRVKHKNIYVTKKIKPYAQEVLNNCSSISSCPPSADPESIDAALDAIDYIKLPSQSGSLQYTFSYNGYNSVPNPVTQSVGLGELSGVTLPSGAQISYAYALDNQTTSTTFLYTKEAIENRIVSKTVSFYNEYSDDTSLVTQTWNYGITVGSGGTVTAPDGSESFEGSWPTGWLSGRSLINVGADGTKVERLWVQSCLTTCTLSTAYATNPYVKAEFTSIKDASGSYSLTAIKDFTYDKNGNVILVKEYDWIAANSSNIQRDSQGYVTGFSGLTPKRITQTEFYNPTPSADSSTFTDTNRYHLTTSPRLLRLPKAAEVQDGGGTPKSRSEMTYDFTSYSSNTLAGNMTQTKVWDSTKAGYSNPLTSTNWITTSASYNSYGLPTVTIDANNVETTITYGCIDGSTSCSSTLQNLYPTKTEVASNYSTLKQTSTATYDFYTGAVITTTDVDNSVTSKTEYDALGRPTKAISAFGDSTLESWTTTTYSDSSRYVVVKSDLETKGDGKKVATQFFDRLGRVRLTKTLEDASTQSATNETDGIKVQTRYKASGTCTFDTNKTCTSQVVSNPYRASTASGAGNETTMGWALSQTRADGKHSEVETFGGAALPKPFLTSGYNTNTTGKVQTDVDINSTITNSQPGIASTVTDQASKQRRSINNALGQLTRVDEPTSSGLGTLSSPNQATYYTYDTLGNMVRVQQGSQNRYFMYSSLGRMLRVRQPEQDVNNNLATSGNPDNNSWTAAFSYDDNGNVLTAIDAKNVTTTNAYDKLNRVTSRAYTNDSSSTPTVNFYYDGNNVSPTPSCAKGKLTSIYSTVSETKYTSFDTACRLLESKQITDGQTYTSSYQYNLSGAIVQETYPSGRVVKNEFDVDGDLSRVTSKKSSTSVDKPYVSNFMYTAGGGILQMKLGNGKWETAKFNTLSQVTELGLGGGPIDASLWKVSYEYGELQTNGTVDTTKNAGNIAKQTLTIPGTSFVQAYKYDSLDRLIEAKETTGSTQNWIQQFGYDVYGNRTSFSQTVGSTTTTSTPSVNASTNRFNTGQGFTYDANGNVVNDTDPVNGHARQYVFNGDNKQTQVTDTTASQTKGTYYYDGEGKRVKKVTETETTVFVYSSGKLVAEYSTIVASSNDAKIAYTTTDHLGSPRIITDDLGQVKARRDFMPFGEDIVSGVGGRTGESGQKYSSTTDGVRQKFTGYQKDNETSLDFAEARMYENRYGRFNAVDPLLSSGQSASPQSFNRYVYVGDNPIRKTDPTGMFGDYYDRNLNYIGSDKKSDGRHYYADVNYLEITENENLIHVTNVEEFFPPTGETDAIHRLLVGFGQGVDDVKSGSWKGVQNVPSTLWNTATTGLFFPFSSIQSDPDGMPELFIPNPLLVQGVSYRNEREARWGQQVTAGCLAAPGVAAAPFAAGGSLSFVPKPLGTTQRLQMYVTRAAREVDALGDAAFTAGQLRALTNNPNLRPMFRGNRIDVMARQSITQDPAHSLLKSNYNRGADFVHPNSGRWWDMTTPGQWRRHVKKYGSNGTLLSTH